jgi:hypothetical protein
MKNRFLIALALLIPGMVSAQDQFQVTGFVFDSASKEPLVSSSVFCQNTTQGTATNKDGKFSMTLKNGGYDLIITYTGYRSKLIQISENTPHTDLQIEMVKEEKVIEEVVMRSSNEVKNGWERYGQFFMENFVGSTPFSKSCYIQNPEVLKFYYYRRADKLKILAEEPVIVKNHALGYTVRYNLDSFLYFYKNDISSYSGFTFFSEMMGTPDSLAYWRKNREKAYYGSRLHFMHSYFDSTIAQSGFIVAMLDEKDETKFNRIWNLYDTLYFTPVDSTTETDIYYPRRISITYTKRTPEDEYLKRYKLPLNIGVQTSYIDLHNVITIKQNGYFYDQRDWVNYGYWSWKNIADQVPYDYTPK